MDNPNERRQTTDYTFHPRSVKERRKRYADRRRHQGLTRIIFIPFRALFSRMVAFP